MYANITNPANFQLQDFAQFGFRVITTDFIPVPGEQYRTLYVLQDAVVTATTQKGDDITSKAILAGTLLHGLFNSVSITSGRVLAYAAGRVTADEIIALYEAYVSALGGTLENTRCAIDTLNDTGVDFFADASLVMIPNGYGTGVVYGQRPLTSDSQLTFTRASTATRVGPNGAIAVVGSNVPRIDYTGGGCGKLLLEPQSTSLILFSEQMDNAAWTKANLSVTANQTASPTGYSDADSLAEQAVSGIHYTGQGITSAAAGTYTFSCFLKQGTTQYGGFRAVVNGFTNRYFVLLDLSNGSVVNTNTTASGVTWTHKVDNYGNGWYRLSITAAHTSGNIDISISTSDTATPTYFGGLPTYLGTNKFIYAWGANITATAYPQSYIPTLGSTVTRLADAASKTGISSLINSAEGVLFVEVAALANDGTSRQLSLSDGSSANNKISIIFTSTTNQIQAFIRAAGSISFNSTFTLTNATSLNKLAIKWKLNDFALWVNGTEAATDISGGVPVGLSKLSFDDADGTSIFFSKVQNLIIFPSALSDAQLAELTTI
jgi:hypothetical protein